MEELIHQGTYSRFLQHINVDQIRTVCELGSRDGLDAIHLSNHFDAEVVAWECNPPAIELCRENIGDNDRVTLVDKACWSHAKTLIFYPVTNGNIGASSAFQFNNEYPHEELEQSQIEVEAVRVDDWWEANRSDSIDLLAMDLQGAELEALKGMGNLLNDVKYIITEGQHNLVYHDTPLITEIESYLAQFGFVKMYQVNHNEWFGDFVYGKAGFYESEGVTYFNHAYNTTIMNERCMEIPLALDFIEQHGDYVEVGAVLPYYGYDADIVIDPFDEKGTDSRRLAECDLTGKNVVCISTLEHIGKAEYGNQEINTHEAFEGLMQIINQADNYFITIPIGYNTPLDHEIEWILEDLDCYGMQRQNGLDEPPRWVKVDPVTHLAYHYHYPFNAANFVLIITNKTI